MSKGKSIATFLSGFSLKELADVVYGAPIEKPGLTIIPVAKLKYGFGFGLGTRPALVKGEGAGAGASAVPVGYLEIRGNDVQFKRIHLFSISSLAIAISVSALAILYFAQRILR